MSGFGGVCPVCSNSGKRSIVRVAIIDGRAPEAISAKRPEPTDHFFDEDGIEHRHNPHVTVTVFTCSLGHRFQERSSWECHCGYKACEAEVTVLP